MLNKIINWLSSPLRSLIEKELCRQHEAASKNIQLELQRRALHSTVDYVEARMAHVDSVCTRFGLLDRALMRANRSGLFCEFGVYSGSSINYIARRTPGPVYGFDSFEGLPERWMNGFPAGHFALHELPRVPSNVQLIKGWFDETLPVFAARHGEDVSFLHVDCDLYSATKSIFAHLHSQIRPGTVIVFDEYFNYPNWQMGEFKAFQEFIGNSPFGYEYIGYNSNDEQAAVVIVDPKEPLIRAACADKSKEWTISSANSTWWLTS